jgi:elongation factor 1-gamma
LLDGSSRVFRLVASQGDGKLVGANNEEAAQVVQWLFFSTNHLETPLLNWYLPVLGFLPYDEKVYRESVAEAKNGLEILDRVLSNRTYLVGERITVADIVVGCALYIGLLSVLGPEHRDPYKHVLRYARTLFAQPQFKAVLGEATFTTEEKKYKPPEPAKPAPSAAPAADGKKPKSALDALPPSSLKLDDWKRFYSNNDTKPDAMNWFWKNFDPEGYSIWRVDYKYNDELTKIFMSSNLIGGFYARLERARKYAFGVLNVYGVDNNNCIGGYFVIRGQEVPFEVYDAPDYDSYTFKKIENLKDEAFRADLADVFAWEGTCHGRPFAVGKVFK